MTGWMVKPINLHDAKPYDIVAKFRYPSSRFGKAYIAESPFTKIALQRRYANGRDVPVSFLQALHKPALQVVERDINNLDDWLPVVTDADWEAWRKGTYVDQKGAA